MQGIYSLRRTCRKWNNELNVSEYDSEEFYGILELTYHQSFLLFSKCFDGFHQLHISTCCYQFSSVTLHRRYPVMWQGHLTLKNDLAAVQLHFLSGNVNLAKLSLPQQSDQRTPALRISQRMRLEQTQLEGVDRRMQVCVHYVCMFVHLCACLCMCVCVLRVCVCVCVTCVCVCCRYMFVHVCLSVYVLACVCT